MAKEEPTLKRLLSLKTEKDVEEFIQSLDVAEVNEAPKGRKYIWRLLNDSVSNAANVNTTTVTIAPIVERITNGFDAVIQDIEYLKNGGKPIEQKNLPATPRGAVEKWFSIPGGDTAKYGAALKDSDRTAMAEKIVKVELFDSDDPRNPTIVVTDNGIGQSPDDFEKTLMSLGRSNKFSFPHLHGTYGHGGSSTYRFCKYSIVISRRDPKTLNGKTDAIGWSIVKREEGYSVHDFKTGKVVDIIQPPVYVYLCNSDGSASRLQAKEDFAKGTRIAHIQYNAKEWENLSRGLGYRLFRNYLFDPVLPFRLIDQREKATFARNIFGDRSTLETADYVVYKNTDEEAWLGSGKLLVRYWLLHNVENPADRPLRYHLERENSRNTIIVTLNGQRHGSLEKSIIAKKCRLPRVSDCLLVQVVLDYLPREVKGRIFTSTRMELVKEGPEIELLESKLIECFNEDEKLQEWENKLGEFHTADDESVKAVNKLLAQLLDVGLDVGIGGLQQTQHATSVGSTNVYTPQDPPSVIRIRNRNDPMEFIKNETKTVYLELNGPDNLFTRRKNRGHVRCVLPSEPGIDVSIEFSKFKDGRLPVSVFARNDAAEHDSKPIKFIFEADNQPNKLEDEGNYIVLPPYQYVAVEPPTEFAILRKSPIGLKIGRNTTIPIGFNGTDDILERANNCAAFEVKFNHPHVSLIRRLGPAHGRIQITLRTDDKAKDGDTFNITCSLKLADGTVMSDARECAISKPSQNDGKEKGGAAETSRPNFKIKTVRKADWPQLGWDESSVGKFEMKKDPETQKDLLWLFVNVDSCHLEEERERRKSLGKTQGNINNVENKYVAYVAYHLYLQYDAEKEEYNQTAVVRPTAETAVSNEDTSDEWKLAELARVAKTLILSFRTLKDLDDAD